MIIVRELYGRESLRNPPVLPKTAGTRAVNTMTYTRTEIERVFLDGTFHLAQGGAKKVTSV